MVSISILLEINAVLTALALAAFGRENLAVSQALAYMASATIVAIFLWRFLSGRGVRNKDVWLWPVVNPSRWSEWLGGAWPINRLLLGIVGGAALGLFALGYLEILTRIPLTSEFIKTIQQQMKEMPDLRISYAVCAIFIAPFAEEYLFRGMLYRALDREWGGWKAILGSATFFAIYHPPMSWLPVGLLGVATAILFKKTGRLAPSVALHMVYNAVVLS